MILAPCVKDFYPLICRSFRTFTFLPKYDLGPVKT